jgi:hypothetical protein
MKSSASPMIKIHASEKQIKIIRNWRIVKNEASPPNDQDSCFGRLTKNPQKLETCEE